MKISVKKLTSNMKECVFEVKILGKTGITLRIKTHTYNSPVTNFELLRNYLGSLSSS